MISDSESDNCSGEQQEGKRHWIDMMLLPKLHMIPLSFTQYMQSGLISSQVSGLERKSRPRLASISWKILSLHQVCYSEWCCTV